VPCEHDHSARSDNARQANGPNGRDRCWRRPLATGIIVRVGPTPDIRLCFLGDSFTQGVGDETGRGWVGRVVERARGADANVTAYNLGVRRETAAQVERRWITEVTPRLRDGDAYGIVLAVGVNDTAVDERQRRLPTHETLRSLEQVVEGARSRNWPVLVVGPALVDDHEHNERILDLSADLSDACGAAGVLFVDVAHGLVGDDAWLADVSAVDDAHPTPGGYAQLAEVIWPTFADWLGTVGTRDQRR